MTAYAPRRSCSLGRLQPRSSPAPLRWIRRWGFDPGALDEGPIVGLGEHRRWRPTPLQVFTVPAVCLELLGCHRLDQVDEGPARDRSVERQLVTPRLLEADEHRRARHRRSDEHGERLALLRLEAGIDLAD